MTLAEIIQAIRGQVQPQPPPPPDFDPNRPWESPSLARPDLAPRPAPVVPPPAATPVPDPWAQAAKLEERQRALGSLGAPMTPMLEVPLDEFMRLVGKAKGKK